MPFRQLPYSDPTRSAALAAIGTASQTIPAAQWPIPASTVDAASTHATAFQKELGEAASSLGNQVREVGEKDAAGARLEMLVSHFFQVFDFAIARGVFPESARPFHQRDAAQGTVPVLNTDALRLLWSQRVLDGEAARERAATAAAPFIPMAMPSVAEIAAARATFVRELGEATAAKLNADNEAREVDRLREPLDTFIRDTWDTIEFFYRHEAPPSLRRKARLWGVTYVLRPGEPAESDPATTPAAPASGTAPGTPNA